MSLFQKSVEKKYLNELDTVLIDSKYKSFQNYFGNPAIQENIRNSKEEQFQEGFLRELFVSVLGYTLNPQPNFNLTTELKNIANSKKADGAILTGEHAPPSVLAVIELKGTDTTDLDKIEAQAFGYKNHHPKCVYVITSNFEKLRFYIQNAVDHLDFDLFNLTREQFSLLWLCLAKDNLLNGLPLKIKESSVLQEEDITKKLYADYSKFREAIYSNLVKNNPETDKLLLFRKTQKLIDRFLFIFFAEDRLLVPPNSISQIIEKWKDDVDFGDAKPLYDTFKKYFHVLNVGRPKSGNRQEIFAYNGGLFAEDEILDNIHIDDAILYDHTLKLSQYNFETDVDVNILGHIFEHSLGDIAAIAATAASEPAAKEHAPLLQVPSIRKRDGIFYTPKYITKYIVENTVGKLCDEKRAALEIIDEEYAKGRKNRKKETIAALDKKLTDYRGWLLSLTILDPACGSGAFLNQALDFLITEHRKIDDLRAQLFGGGLAFSDITTDILEKNIYGVDINEESVEIAKLSLWLRTAQKGRKLNKLNNNIKCGNSLIDDPAVAGEKAFHWQNEFPNIFQKKCKKAWHITTATHNSRYSQRMFDSFVKLGEPVWLSEKEEIIVSETIAEIAEKDKLNILAYNICGDHAHILLVCEEEELPKIVQKIKSMSARACNIAMGRTIPAGPGTREQAPLSEEPDAGQTGEHAPRTTRGETQYHLWTQKFGQKEITSEEQLQNTIEYIRNNRKKHGLSDGACSVGSSPVGSGSAKQNKGASSLVDTPPVDTPSSGFSSSCSSLAEIAKRITCTREDAFRTEYKGGFDVVIGNPPYVHLEKIKETSVSLKKAGYKTYHSQGDIYCVFVEKGIELLNSNGLISYIMPNKWLQAGYGKPLREYLLNYKMFELIDFGDIQIFDGATTYPCIFISQKAEPGEKISISVLKESNSMDFKFNVLETAEIFETKSFSGETWVISSNKEQAFLESLKTRFSKLNQIVKASFGLKTGLTEAFLIDEETKQKIVKADFKAEERINPFIQGRDLTKYNTVIPSSYLILFEKGFTNKNIGEQSETRNWLQAKFPSIENWLAPFKEKAENRTDKGDYWWELRACDYYPKFAEPKIMYQAFQVKPCFIYDEKGLFCNNSIWFIPTTNKVLLGVLNSKMGWWLITKYCTQIQNGHQLIWKYFGEIPVPELKSAELTGLVEKMIATTQKQQSHTGKFIKHLVSRFSIEKVSTKLENWPELDFRDFLKELQKANVKLSLSEEAEWMNYFNEQKQKAQTLKTEIDKTDREIDRMVYELYGLTEEEIRIVEGAV